MTAEALARIDAEIVGAQIALSVAQRCQALHVTPATGTVVRWLEEALRALREARALIPEPPTDDEREALARELYLLDPHTFPVHPLGDGTYDDAEITPWEEIAVADPEWANACRENAGTIMASAPWRNRGRGPITEAEVERAAAALYFEDCGERVSDEYRATLDFDAQFRAYARAALEAARDAEAGR